MSVSPVAARSVSVKPASVPFEVLDCALVLAGLIECAQVAAFAGFLVPLARIKAVMAGFELADHVA
jgi:hypothetical protein